MKYYYITTTTPYVNAKPHIGFALEIVAADVIARYHKSILGREVLFNTGTDEHGQKIYQEALKHKQDPQSYCDIYAKSFAQLKPLLNLSYTNFIRTTDKYHVSAAQEFWNLCNSNGDIYKKLYKTTYCVGCELDKQASEIIDNKCPLHPTKELEIREEENYFFRFSKYQKALLKLYEEQPDFVQPASKMKEIKAFVTAGLNDFSISRLKDKMPWGVPVPNDADHVMYVWFDALINYISTLGWPKDQENFKKFWPVVQIAGKDNLRQQSAMWQAMLLSAGLPNSKKILINGFISIDGQKMSKSLGNVISPDDLVKRYGVDGTRYLLTHIGPIGGDMDVSWQKFSTIYTANLSNGLGNLCSRVAKLCEKSEFEFPVHDLKLSQEFTTLMNNYQLDKAIHWVFDKVGAADKFLSEKKPWLQTGDEQKQTLEKVVKNIRLISYHLQPFLPETAEKIKTYFNQENITAIKPLFPRV